MAKLRKIIFKIAAQSVSVDLTYNAISRQFAIMLPDEYMTLANSETVKSKQLVSRIAIRSKYSTKLGFSGATEQEVCQKVQNYIKILENATTSNRIVIGYKLTIENGGGFFRDYGNKVSFYYGVLKEETTLDHKMYYSEGDNCINNSFYDKIIAWTPEREAVCQALEKQLKDLGVRFKKAIADLQEGEEK